ncbi:hypothetical protein [Nocardia huaxiensis]|uniref:Uncharacterized protein n=1 Tax=Nocardia huaxiensis TaxID=2755382 RepID=A0A7D6ZEA4_9NOCA|nr:hypothetical protein [Nocardia huaxiensis]QLY33488.1 hypothetical protein H0264_15770 [Nocardia huaxiensis]UFS99602.1 hypothetical protein LPY97_17795 [Nocardia huaxiensis]
MTYEQPQSFPDPNMYQPFPGAAQPYPGAAVTGPRTPPPTVTYAFYLMLAGAVLGVLGIVVGFTQLPAAREKAAEASGGVLASGDIDTIVMVSFGFGIVLGVLSVGLWVWMAFMNRAGRNWARVTGTVFFGLYSASMLFLLMPGAEGTAVSLAVSVVTWLVGLAAVILLWNKQSRAYFQPAPVYPTYPGYPPYSGPYPPQ